MDDEKRDNTQVNAYFDFPKPLRRQCLALLFVGTLFLLLGIFLSSSNPHTHHAGIEPAITTHDGDENAASAHHEVNGGWRKRLLANLWLNNVFFVGISLVGVLFVALQYVTSAGWSALIKRVPESFGHWLPIGGVLMLLLFLVGHHDIFHWTHSNLYEKTLADGTANPTYDPIINGKKGFLNTPFYLARMLIFFGGWCALFWRLRKHSLKEDTEGGIGHWQRMRVISTIFVIFFAVSSSVAAWDWILSIDTHWFSTMFGWYVFSSWFVGGLALITYLVVLLKERGYLPQVNAEHFHDLGKYVFGFSIFWMYIWFSQFLLIYYANIPEESVYFVERMDGSYATLFYTNLIVNFFFPFLFLMTHSAKRYAIFLKIACAVVFVGHWLDIYLMVTPGILRESGGIGWMELGAFMIFLGGFSYVLLRALSKVPLVARHHPMLAESVHHHT